MKGNKLLVMSFMQMAVYEKSFALAMEVFEITKSFPKEERYSLTDQVRRSSRSVCANLAEAYRRRRYPAHFLSKLGDCDSENSETQVWIEFAYQCSYINEMRYKALQAQSTEVGKLLGSMILNHKDYL